MDNLELEVVVIDGKKFYNCSKVLILFHAVLLMFMGAFCSYYISMNKLDYDKAYTNIKEQIKFTNMKGNLINQKIDKTESFLEHKNNYLVSFVQKGYECGTSIVNLDRWWENVGNHKKKVILFIELILKEIFLKNQFCFLQQINSTILI